MRHLELCDHFKWDDGTVLGEPVPASEEQMRTLPACKTCLARQSGDLGDDGRAGPMRTGELCPSCYMTLPLTGICDNCG